MFTKRTSEHINSFHVTDLCGWNWSVVSSDKRPLMRTFDDFVDARLFKFLNKQLSCRHLRHHDPHLRWINADVWYILMYIYISYMYCSKTGNTTMPQYRGKEILYLMTSFTMCRYHLRKIYCPIASITVFMVTQLKLIFKFNWRSTYIFPRDPSTEIGCHRRRPSIHHPI